MKISSLGKGPLGCVAAANLARDGYGVGIVMDTHASEVAMVNDGPSPFVHSGAAAMRAANPANLRMLATQVAATAIAREHTAFESIQPTSAPIGSLDQRYMRDVAEKLGAALTPRLDLRLPPARGPVAGGVQSLYRERVAAYRVAGGKQGGHPAGPPRGGGSCAPPAALRQRVAATARQPEARQPGATV